MFPELNKSCNSVTQTLPRVIPLCTWCLIHVPTSLGGSFTSGIYHTHISPLSMFKQLALPWPCYFLTKQIVLLWPCFTNTFPKGSQIDSQHILRCVCACTHKCKMATTQSCLSKALLSTSQLDFKEHPISCRLLIQNVISVSDSHGISTTSLPHCSWQAERALRLQQLVEKRAMDSFLSQTSPFSLWHVPQEQTEPSRGQ